MLCSSPPCASGLLLLVHELGGDGLRQVHQLVGGLDVADDGGKVALQLELPLHHPLDRIERLADQFLPPGVRRADDELGLVALLRAHQLALTALAVPQVAPGRSPRTPGRPPAGTRSATGRGWPPGDGPARTARPRWPPPR